MTVHLKFKILSLLFFGCVISHAQQTPAPPQSQPVLITGAVAHLGNGQVIENSAIAFEDGKLTIVADARLIRIDGSKNYRIIDATGKHIYPGFIAPNTNLGLVEINAVRATRDHSEVGQMTPNVRSIIAYNTDSRVTPTVRSNGILLAQITPQGGTIPGSSSIVELDAWNWEDAAYHQDNGIHLDWPSLFSYSRRGSSEVINKNKNYKTQVQEIEAFFLEAKAYFHKRSPKEKNLKFEAMRGLFDKTKKLFIHTDLAKTMMESILFAKKHELDAVIVGGRESWMITDFLKEHEIPIILSSTQALPSREGEDIDQPFKTPVQLHEAGVLFCFSHGGYDTQRNLPFQAGQAVGFGLDYEEALKALTLNTAMILGIDQTVGSLEAEKDATLFISDGDVLDMRTSKVERAFIRGKEIDLDNKQKALYRKFKAKYHSNN